MSTISKDAAKRLALKSCKKCKGRGGKPAKNGMMNPCSCIKRLAHDTHEEAK